MSAKSHYKLSYNSPVVLTYAAVCLVCLIIDQITQGWFNTYVMVCYGHPSLLDPMTYVRCVTYIFGHSGWSHYASNMLLMLLVGPVVEEKYGSVTDYIRTCGVSDETIEEIRAKFVE